MGVPEIVKKLSPPSTYEVKEILKFADRFDADSILKIINKTKYDEKNKDTYLFSKATYSIMQPISSNDDPITYLKSIDKDSKFYKYSIYLARDFLQSKSCCQQAPTKHIIDFANSMIERGDNSPLVYLTLFIESTINKSDYGIGDVRIFPFHDNASYRLCLQQPAYYINAYKAIRNKYENDNFKITYTGAKSLNTGLNKSIQIDLTYLHLYKLIGSLHGSAALSYYLSGNNIRAQEEKLEFLKYFPNGITSEEKKAFSVIYGSVYLYLLDGMFKQYKISYR